MCGRAGLESPVEPGSKARSSVAKGEGDGESERAKHAAPTSPRSELPPDSATRDDDDDDDDDDRKQVRGASLPVCHAMPCMPCLAVSCRLKPCDVSAAILRVLCLDKGWFPCPSSVQLMLVLCVCAYVYMCVFTAGRR